MKQTISALKYDAGITGFKTWLGAGLKRGSLQYVSYQV